MRASETMAQTDSGRMNKYKSKINRVGSQSGIDPALIAAIISRESRAGNVLHDGWGDHGNAWGLMQVDKYYLGLTCKILAIDSKRKIYNYFNFQKHVGGY